jgi:hypothetical protein
LDLRHVARTDGFRHKAPSLGIADDLDVCEQRAQRPATNALTQGQSLSAGTSYFLNLD